MPQFPRLSQSALLTGLYEQVMQSCVRHLPGVASSGGQRGSRALGLVGPPWFGVHGRRVGAAGRRQHGFSEDSGLELAPGTTALGKRLWGLGVVLCVPPLCPAEGWGPRSPPAFRSSRACGLPQPPAPLGGAGGTFIFQE